MGSMQCNVEFGYQLSICCRNKENHNLDRVGRSQELPECKLVSSQQSDIKPAGPNIIPYLCRCFFFCFVLPIVIDPYGRILGFVDRSRYFFFKVAPQLYSRG
jgi:hypothetical protein